MPKTIIAEGKTTNEAIENGLKQLRVPKNLVDVKVLDKDDKRSFFSILTPRVVKVELTVREESENALKHELKAKEQKVYSAEELDKAEKSLKKFLDDFTSKIGEDITYEISKNEYGVEISINGDNAGFLIGYRGETLYAESENALKHELKAKEQKVYSAEELDKAEKSLKKFLDDFTSKIGEDITYEISKNEYGVEISINGDNAGFLIGYRGETLYAVQNILSAVASKGQDTRIRVILDIANYKEKREKTLEDLAEKVAKTVIRTGKSITLEPMKAYERKIIHSKLQDSKKVTTNSIGEEPRRRVVISLK